MVTSIRLNDHEILVDETTVILFYVNFAEAALVFMEQPGQSVTDILFLLKVQLCLYSSPLKVNLCL